MGGTAYLAFYCFAGENWIGLALSLWSHGTIRAVAASGTHELSHGTVFKSKWLNAFFLRIWGLLAWDNFNHYKMSHTYHHLYTLHPRGDGEVVLPSHYSLGALDLLQQFTFDVSLFVTLIGYHLRIAVTGKFSDEWSMRIFTPAQNRARRAAIRWVRVLIAFHVIVAVVSLILGAWMIPVVVSLGFFFGRWWIYFIGATMHAGLRDNVPDFRLCTRTIKLDPFSSYLRWNMHYHIEHHMFAAVPCYNLGKLHRALAFDMPRRRSVIEAWREIRDTEKRQRTDPDYQFDTPIPAGRDHRTVPDPLGSDIGDIRPRGYVE